MSLMEYVAFATRTKMVTTNRIKIGLAQIIVFAVKFGVILITLVLSR